MGAIILGAGIAGLTAAYRLARAHHPVILLEARDRCGGRIHTIPAKPTSPAIELGAEFVHGEKVSTWAMIRQAGLATQEVPGTHWVSRSGKLSNDAAISEDLEALTDRIDPQQPDRPVQQTVDDVSLTSDRKKLLVHYIEGFHAADPRRMSSHAFAKSERATSEIEGSRQFRVTEGYDQLIQWLAAQLKNLNVPIHLGSCAELIRWKRGLVEAQIRSSGSRRSYAGDALIVTLPVAVLKSRGPGAVKFEPELTIKAAALAGIQVGEVTKIVLQFKSQFWPVRNFGFVHDVDGCFPTWWADERGLFLTGWAGGPKAHRLREASDAELLVKAIRALAALFGLDPEAVRGEVLGFHRHNWSTDPFSLGAYTYLGVGSLNAPAALAEPIEHTLFFAGEATAPDGQQGTVHGAIESAHRAAAALLGPP